MPYKYGNEVNRNEFLIFLKLGEMEGYKILGVGVEDLSIDLEADEVERKWIVNKDPITEVRSMSKSTSVENIVIKGEPLHKPIMEAYRKQEAIKGSAIQAYTWLEVDSTQADLQDIILIPTNLGGGEDLAISYDIKFNGSPTLGTATLEEATQSATFTADGE